MTMKQMGVIYRAFKEGKLTKTTKADIDKAYYCVKRMGWELEHNHHDVWEATRGLKAAVDAIFAKDYETADNIVWGFDTVPAV